MTSETQVSKDIASFSLPSTTLVLKKNTWKIVTKATTKPTNQPLAIQ